MKSGVLNQLDQEPLTLDLVEWVVLGPNLTYGASPATFIRPTDWSCAVGPDEFKSPALS